MLIYRLLTAFILIPIVISVLVYVSPFVFDILITLMAIPVAWEWSKLIGKQTAQSRAIYCLQIVLIIIALWLFPILSALFIGLGIIWWAFATFQLIYHPLRFVDNASKFYIDMGLVFIVSCWAGLSVLFKFEQGYLYVILLFFIVWGADSGAYFSGKFWGKRKLLADISPGKTIEGVYGGVVTTVLVTAIFAYFLPLSWLQVIILTLLVIPIALFSVVGDLTISAFKRQLGVKDTGSIFPGHGGLLDRLDSLLAATPFFAVTLLIIS